MICSRSTACSPLRVLLLAGALALASPASAGVGDIESSAGDDDPPGGTTATTGPPPGSTPPGSTTPGSTTPGSTTSGATTSGTTARGGAAPAAVAPGTPAATTTTTATQAAPGATVSAAVVTAPAVAPMSVSMAAVAASPGGDGPGGRCAGDTPAARRPPVGPPPAANAASAKALGETEAAVRLTSEARALLRTESTPRSPAVYCDVSADLADRGEYRAAIQAAGMALFLGRSAGDRRLLAYAARNLAYAYSLAGALDQASHWAGESLRYAAGLEDARAAETITAPVLKIQGDVALRRGRAGDAARLYGRALAKAGKSALGPWLGVARAHAALAQGQVGRASALLAAARRDPPEALKAALARAEGEAALAAKDAPRAAALFQAAVDRTGVDRAGGDPYARMWALHGLARAKRAAKETEGAFAAFAQAIEAAEAVRQRFRSEEFKSGFFGTAQDIFDDAIATAADAGRAETALDFSERSRARALLDLLIGRVETQAQGKAGTLTFVDRVAPAEPLAALRRGLPAGAAIVVYHVLDRRTLAWVLRPGELRQVALPIGRRALGAAVRGFVASVLAAAADAPPRAAALHGTLVAPLDLRADEALLVVAHDALHALPFAALSDGKSWLIERRAVASLPSLSALNALVKAQAAAPSGALVFGNPDLGDPAEALPAAEREAASVAALLPDAKIHVRAAATRERLIADAPGRRVVHIAAHSAIDPLDPLASPLYLAGPKPSGAMTARDFYALDLRAARLIALSACQTGLGTVGRGSEIWGFQRTVLAAGARGLLVSLWAVEDEATAALMTGFYRRLAGMPMLQALRQSQIDLIRAGRDQPLYWAAFTLVGDWR